MAELNYFSVRKYLAVKDFNNKKGDRSEDSMKNEKPQRCWELLFRNTELLQDLIGKCYPVRQYAQITVSQVRMCMCICRHEPDGVMPPGSCIAYG